MEKADLSNATKMIDEVLENSSHGIDKVKKAAKGVIPGIERADITGALIPIPALAEQCRIVEKVDAALQQANMHL